MENTGGEIARGFVIKAERNQLILHQRRLEI